MKKHIKKVANCIYKIKLKRKLIKDINNHKKIYKNIKLTKEQKEKIKEIWNSSKYSGSINVNWHRMFYAISGRFDEKYIPELYFQKDILPKLNPQNLKRQFADKMLTQYLFSNIDMEDVKLPETIIYNCNGFFYNKNGIISSETVEEELYNSGYVIIKPSTETDSGKGVELFDFEMGVDKITEKSIKEIIFKYRRNFVVQKKITQHRALAELNESSVNTIRINSYICEGQVFTTPIAMRIGRKGHLVDNAHAGGIQVGIDKDGKMREYAYTEFGEKYDKHPDSGVCFLGYQIPKIDIIINFVRKYHHRIPHIGFIGWDFTIDENENVILIETNIISPGIRFPQYCNGESLFGENTEKMIRLIGNEDC